MEGRSGSSDQKSLHSNVLCRLSAIPLARNADSQRPAVRAFGGKVANRFLTLPVIAVQITPGGRIRKIPEWLLASIQV